MNKPILCFFIGYVPDFNKKDTEDFYGSELALINLSRYFKEKYRVIVFGESIEIEKKINDIEYLNTNKYDHFKSLYDIEIIIISRYIYHFLDYELKSNKIFLWIEDVYILPYYKGTSIDKESKFLLKNIIDKIDGIITLTDWHRNYFIDFYEINPDKVYKIGNGINVEDFDYKIEKVKNRFIWTSHVYRGLINLIEYFNEIRKNISDAELYIYRDKESIGDEILNEINKYDYIHFKGKLNNKDLIKEFKKSDIWFYPTNFDETYCISAVEAQMSECVCITSKKAALKETVNDRGILIDDIVYSDEYKQNAIKNVIEILNDKKLKEHYQKKGKEWASKQTWEKRAKEWYELFEK